MDEMWGANEDTSVNGANFLCDIYSIIFISFNVVNYHLAHYLVLLKIVK